jgi:hypothetical protein
VAQSNSSYLNDACKGRESNIIECTVVSHSYLKKEQVLSIELIAFCYLFTQLFTGEREREERILMMLVGELIANHVNQGREEES